MVLIDGKVPEVESSYWPFSGMNLKRASGNKTTTPRLLKCLKFLLPAADRTGSVLPWFVNEVAYTCFFGLIRLFSTLRMGNKNSGLIANQQPNQTVQFEVHRTKNMQSADAHTLF
jgi:hypothetical protein